MGGAYVDLIAVTVTSAVCLATEFVRLAVANITAPSSVLTPPFLSYLSLPPASLPEKFRLSCSFILSLCRSAASPLRPPPPPQVVKQLAKRDVLSSSSARKLLHISIGPVFLACWPLFSESVWAPYVAAAVPGVMATKFAVIGAGEQNARSTF